ncbi:MAG: HlyC/CorC family transporter [Chloroflexi bacterium]|nr:HlyC/CorC family transporter [Chloroflexota bacterium]
MSTDAIIGLVIAVAAGGMLLLVSAAEAGVTAISRRRTRAHAGNGVAGLLDSYIRQRQRLLRALSAAATFATVALTLGLTVLFLNGREVGVAAAVLAGLAVLIVAGVLRENARAIALVSPETTGLRLASIIAVLHLALEPLAWLLSAPSRGLLRLVGRSPEIADEDPASELLGVLEAPADPEAQESLSEERRMMRGILDMSDQTVREVMSPRIDIVAVSVGASIGDVMKLIISSGFSRIPLYEESIDRIVGVIYAKDLLAYLQTGAATPSLEDIARPPYFVPETKRADQLLADLRRDQTHVAIVVDEYGGTAGLVTVEDVLEEIVGEIVDEYDTDEVEVERVSADEAIVDARLAIDDLNEMFGTEIENEDFDTVGGLVFSLLGRLATPGDQVESDEHGLALQVLSVQGRRIRRVRISTVNAASEAAAV